MKLSTFIDMEDDKLSWPRYWMWAQDGSGVCLPTLRKTRLQKQEMIIFPACRYVILSVLYCSPGHEPSILSQIFCIVFLINHSSVSPGPCQDSVSVSHVSTVITRTPTRKNLQQNPPLLTAGAPTMMWRMDHSGLHDHTTATALLYMRPLLLRAGE